MACCIDCIRIPKVRFTFSELKCAIISMVPCPVSTRNVWKPRRTHMAKNTAMASKKVMKARKCGPARACNKYGRPTKQIQDKACSKRSMKLGLAQTATRHNSVSDE